MKSSDLIGKGGCNAFAALNLINLISPFFREETEEEGIITKKTTVLTTADLFQSPELVTLLESNDPVELVKGLCFVMFFTASHWLCGDDTPAPVFKAIRDAADAFVSMQQPTRPELILDSQYRALDLLDALEGNGGSFYLIAYSLHAPLEEVLSLCSMFCTLARCDMGKEPQHITDFIRQFLEKKLVG